MEEHKARSLSPIERQLAGARPCMGVRFQGAVDHDDMTAAFLDLMRRYPVLGSHLETHGDEYTLVAPRRAPDPPISYCAGGERELRQRADEIKGPELGHAFVMEGHGGGLVALSVDHSVADGAGILHMLQELWSKYLSVGTNEPTVNRPSYAFPRPPEELLAGCWEGDFSIRQAVGSQQGPLPVLGGSIQFQISLERAETDSLRQRCRAAGVTVHSFIGGAALYALRRHIAAGEDSYFSCLSTIDLRNRVLPEVAVDEVTNFIAFSNANIRITTSDGELDIARSLRRDIDRSIENRELEFNLNAAINANLPSSIDAHMSRIAINNMGFIPQFAGGREASVINFFRVIPEAAQTPYPCFLASCYDGLTTIYCVYPSGLIDSASAEAVNSRFEHVIRSFLKSA